MLIITMHSCRTLLIRLLAVARLAEAGCAQHNVQCTEAALDRQAQQTPAGPWMLTPHQLLLLLPSLPPSAAEAMPAPLHDVCPPASRLSLSGNASCQPNTNTIHYTMHHRRTHGDNHHA